MAQLVVQVTDNENADFLRQLLERFDFVTHVDIQAVVPALQRERILNYAGGWADLSAADWEQLQTTLQRRGLASVTWFRRDNEIVPLDRGALEKSAEIYVYLRQNGQLINEADILIAGMALAQNAILVTNNTAHFSRIPQLAIENWLET